MDNALLKARSRPDWGIVVLPCELYTVQNATVVMRGEHRLMVPR